VLLGNHIRLNAQGDHCRKFVPLPFTSEFDSSAENVLLYFLQCQSMHRSCAFQRTFYFKPFVVGEKGQMLNS
jgi:hypothetical protein